MNEFNASKSHQDESVKALLAQIDTEYRSAFLGFSGLSLGTSRHDFINHRMERIGVAGRQLVELLGEDTAGRLIVEQMSKATERGEINS